MKCVRGPKVLRWGVALALGLLPLISAHAVYDPSSTVKEGKRWAISAGLRTGYDDNTTTASSNKKGSWFGGFNVLGRYSYPTDTSFFSVATSGNGNFFASRPGDLFDSSDAVDMTFAHTFSPRLSLDVANHFRYGQEPQLADNNTIYRRSGDYINNGISVGLSYQLSTKWFLDFSLGDDIWYYSDTQLGDDLSRQAVSIGPSLRYRLTEKTSLSLGYSYTTIIYTTSPRDAQSHNVTVGISQSITSKWSASLNSGISIRTEDNITSKATHTEPFFSFDTSYAVSEKASFNAGVRNSFQETDEATYYFAKSTSGYLGFNWSFARNLSSSSTLNIVNNGLDNAIVPNTASGDEMTYLFNQGFNWSLRENVSLSLNYTWTLVDSNLPNRSYRRNVVSVGANFSF